MTFNNALIAVLIALVLGACAMTGPAVTVGMPQGPEPLEAPYTKAETDAINAVIQCKNMARTSIQIARCETRR